MSVGVMSLLWNFIPDFIEMGCIPQRRPALSWASLLMLLLAGYALICTQRRKIYLSFIVNNIIINKEKNMPA
jgi:hypothetical protein